MKTREGSNKQRTCLRLTSLWLPSLISLAPIGSCKLKENSISHLNKSLVTHLARWRFEILHLSQLIQYRKNCIFYGNSSFKLVKDPLLALNPQYASFFFFNNLSCKLHESIFAFQSKLFSQKSVMLNFRKQRSLGQQVKHLYNCYGTISCYYLYFKTLHLIGHQHSLVF